MIEFNAEMARENMILAPSKEFDNIIKEIEKASKQGAGNLVTTMSFKQTTINKLAKLGFKVKDVASESRFLGTGIRYFVSWVEITETKQNNLKPTP